MLAVGRVGDAMTLVERFIEFNGWSITRKMALGYAVLAVWHLSAWIVAYFASKAALVDAHLALWSLGLLTGYVVAVFLASVAFVRVGWDFSRGFAYVIWAGYAALVSVMIYLYGSASSPLAFMVVACVSVATVFFDVRVGVVCAGTMLLLLMVIGILESYGVLPYAPVVIERSIDGQRNDVWFAAFYFVAYFQPALIGLAMIALVVAARELQESRLKQAQALIRRYVPAQVADSIISGSAQTTARHERRKLTIFFSDLCGFTDISEELEPEDLSQILNEYFSAMTAIARKHGGTVDELSGDAILIFFGAPHATDDKDHALRAVNMAVEMQQAMTSLNATWLDAGITETLRVRMGINTGVVTIGSFGTPDRMKYAALGKHVNVAARLQSHCEPGCVLLSEATWLLVKDRVPCTAKGQLQLKGIHKPVMIYEVA
jgi:class 3 adenylate cyclase